MVVALRAACACGHVCRVGAARQQHCYARMRLYVCMRAVLAGTEVVCIGSVRPVDGPVKISAEDSVYM